MYSTSIIDRNTQDVETALNVKLVRFSVSESTQLSAHIRSVRPLAGSEDPSDGVPQGPSPRRPLSTQERAFIRNERVLCRLDFLYWAERYAYILDDKGGMCLFSPWESQRLVLKLIAKVEESMHLAVAKGDPVDGVRLVLHKARQLGATMLAQLLMWHRLIFHGHVRALIASVDDEKTKKVRSRGTRVLDHLPRWLSPEVTYSTIEEGLTFGKLDNTLLLQHASQSGGIGQGEQWEVSHLTECASWPNAAYMIEYHFFPTIPQSARALCVLESTAQGRHDWWHTFTENVRQGKERGWAYAFVPWYVERTKYRAAVPQDWRPSDMSMAHAKLVAETSHEWVGRTVMLPKEQLYWYECEREKALRAGTLNLFLTNYCAVPSESFQHSTVSAFSPEVIDRSRPDTARGGVAYELRTGNDAESEPLPESYRASLPFDPQPYRLSDGSHVLVPVVPADSDPRGYVWVFRPPQRGHVYSLGCDPTVGISRWNRAFRTKDDKRTDNGAVQIIDVGSGGAPDVQVAEFAAPIDPEDLAAYVNMLGRMYSDPGGDEPALATIEVYPGPGLITQRALINIFSYTHLFIWKTLDSLSPRRTNYIGWTSTSKSVRDLWIRGIRHVANSKIKILSPFTLDEMTDAEMDQERMRGRAQYGAHDDRVTALLLAIWAAHDWTAQLDLDRQPTAEQGATAPNWQASDCTRETMMDEWEERFSQLLEGGG